MNAVQHDYNALQFISIPILYSFKKNNEIQNYNTRTKDMFRISHESQTFSSVGAKIWNALSITIDVIVTLIKVKNSLKVYLLSNSLVINYPK